MANLLDNLIIRNSVTVAGNEVLTTSAIGSTVAAYSHSHSYLPLSGGTVTGTITASGGIAMSNTNLTGVNHITINDAGPNEGIEWLGGNGWKIYESPDDLTTNAAGSLQFVNVSTRRMTIDINGNVFALGSSRAPIFYDSDNTAYYVDPSSSSQSAYFRGRITQISQANSSWPYLFTTSAVGDDNSSGFWVSSVGYPDMRLRREDGTVRALISSWERSYTSFGFTDSTDMRAPIFYDSNNTGYYLDPASFSQLNTAKFGTTASSWGSAYIATDSGSSWSSGAYPYIGSSGGSSGSLIMLHNPHIPFRTDNPRSGASGRSGIRCAIDTAATSWWDIGLTGDEFDIYKSSSNAQLFRVTSGGNAIALSNMQAPIFYDSNNTGYYVDPASTSNISGLTVVGSSALNATTFFGGYGPGSGPGLAVENLSTFTRFAFWGLDFYDWNNGIQMRIDSGYVSANNSFRAPIFYDSNNTSYYVDPASTSSLYNMQGYFHSFPYREWDFTWGSHGANNSMPSMSFAMWDNYTQSGAPSSYGTVLDFYGYSGHQHDQIYFAQGSIQHRYGWYGNNTWGSWREIYTSANGSMQTPILYDSNNTGYYIDPAGTLRQNHMDVNTGSVARLGINNTASETRYGFSLYGGYNSGEPTYGMLFTGTSLGSHGSISGSWATYFTMNNDTTRGWIFRRVGSGNCASISAGGHAAFNGDVTAYYSDMRLKTKIADIENPIEKVKSLSGFIYEPNEIAESYGYEKERKVGVSAQEVQAVLPEAVKDAPIGDGYLTVQYDKLVPLLIEAIKEQQKQIEELKAIVDGLTK